MLCNQSNDNDNYDGGGDSDMKSAMIIVTTMVTEILVTFFSSWDLHAKQEKYLSKQQLIVLETRQNKNLDEIVN